MNIYESIRSSLNETNYLKKYYNKLDTMSDKALYKAWLEVKDAPDEEGSSEEIEYTMASDALWEIEGELCRRGYLDEDNNKTDKWKELEESSDVARDLAIEPGSSEEEALNNLYEEKKIDWTDLGGSDQTAVEHYFSSYGRDFTGKCWNDIESEIRSACHEIGYANEELIDTGYWSDGDMDPEPNEKLVGDYIYYNHFLPSLKKNETEEPTGTSKFIEVSRKSVEDSDGFMTDYTLYHDTETDKYVTVFGDQDIYKPEDGDFDMEFETAEEANEWFHSYTGFAEGEDFKETPKSIASLKSLLEQLADMDFYHNMKDNWTREDFEIDDRNNKKIQKVIDQLKEQGVETKYRMGYPIEYSDEIKKEAEEDKLSNEEWFKLHEDEIKELDRTDSFVNKETE